MENKVSVIIAARNAQEFIRKSVYSAMRQEMPAGASIEVIVIDDASTDATGRIVDDIAAHFPGWVISLHNAENIGVAESRNIGIRKAKGEYIAFLDADDYWRQGKIKAQLAAMEESGAVMCATARALIREDGKKTGYCIGVPQKVTWKMILGDNTIACSSVLAKADPVREFGMSHEELHEDYILWLNILKKYGPCVGINTPYLASRLSSGGKSRSKLKSARMRWGVYRLMGIPFVSSLYYFGIYTIKGFLKYRGTGIRL